MYTTNLSPAANVMIRKMGSQCTLVGIFGTPEDAWESEKFADWVREYNSLDDAKSYYLSTIYQYTPDEVIEAANNDEAWPIRFWLVKRVIETHKMVLVDRYGHVMGFVYVPEGLKQVLVFDNDKYENPQFMRVSFAKKFVKIARKTGKIIPSGVDQSGYICYYLQ